MINTFSPCKRFKLVLTIKICGVVCGLLPLFVGPATWAQSTPASINPISTFQLQEGSSAVSWSQSGSTVDSSTGNSIISFQDGNGGSSTMTWKSTGALASWVIYPPAGSPQVYTDATPQGQPGAFTLTSGNFGSNNVLSINGHSYVPNGSFLAPAQAASTFGFSPLTLFQFGYGGFTYKCASTGTDYNGTSVGVFSSQTSTVIVTGVQGLQIYGSNGSHASYSIDPTKLSYTYQPSSSAPNQLTQINGYFLTAVGDTLSLPLPISSFICDGMTSTFYTIYWHPYILLSGGSGMFWEYTGGHGGQASSNSDGSLNNLSVSVTIYSPKYTYYSAGITPSSSPNTYNIQAFSSYAFTAINGTPYVQQGNLLVPQGPVSTLSYGASTYQFTGYSQASDGNWLAQYQSNDATPVTASVEYSPSNNAIVKMSINAVGGGTAYYVDGATVGQPGAYVWSTSSTAANSLTTVNNTTYNSSGNSDLPGTATTTNGVFKIRGNFMSLGSWSNNTNQSGFDLSYYDGQTSTYPASVEFTGNRPLISWLWDVASQDGTISNAVMLLDENSRLSLYPPADPTATTPSTAAPTVVLDPNPNGTSRFDGPVRIAPQGDLSMGEFTAEPTPTPAQ